MKKNTRLHIHEKDPIQSNDTTVIGPYTIIKLTTQGGREGFGVSKKSIVDKDNPDRAVLIAHGRAETSLYLNARNSKKRRHLFIG